MEVWDAYDEKFNLIKDTTLIRGKDIPDGMYHLVCDVIVRHIDGDILLMQRDYCKTGGGLWEATAGGSALKGESPLICAKRELLEETGIDSGKLIELGSILCKEHKTIYFEFLCITNCIKDSIKLQKGETINYNWVSFENINKEELITKRIFNFYNH